MRENAGVISSVRAYEDNSFPESVRMANLPFENAVTLNLAFSRFKFTVQGISLQPSISVDFL